MKRTKLKDRILPDYTRAEEIFNMTSHIVGGGISYTVGAVFYGIGAKKRYIHSVFHLFVVLGSILQFICIFFYIIL